jgi:hypothetical protein
MSHVLDATPDGFGGVSEVTYLGTVHATLATLRRRQPRSTRPCPDGPCGAPTRS